MSSDVERIKEKISIVDVIGQYVKLIPAGKHYKGLSPFTSEKTPSFFVSSDKGLYHCFSTGKGGDIFTFIQEVEGVDFKGALKLLADQAGIELQDFKTNKEEKDERERLYHVLEEATHFFKLEFQKNQEAQEYIKKRGVEHKTLQAFSIGFAPPEWHALWEFLKKKGIKEADALKAGVIKQGNKGVYDVFRDRIIFPIRDSSGRVAAFSGRILHPHDDSPKYVNSPETSIFNKSKILYGYDRARTLIRKHDFALVVEGQMDLVMSHQAGCGNTVATSGTGLTEDHLMIIKRLTNNILLVFDNDKAGWNSTLRAANLALPLGINLKTVILEGGKDPADIILADPLKWKDAIRHARHIIDVALDKCLEISDDKRKQWLTVQEIVLPLVASLTNSIDTSYFIDIISRKTLIPIESLTTELHKVSLDTTRPYKRQYQEKTVRREKKDRKIILLEQILSIIEWQKNEQNPLLKSDSLHERILDILGDLPKIELTSALLFEIEQRFGMLDNLESVVEDLILSLEEEHLKEHLAVYATRIKHAEMEGDEKTYSALLIEYRDLSKRLEEVRSAIKKLMR